MHAGEITKETKFMVIVLWINSSLVHAIEWKKYIASLLTLIAQVNTT